MSVFGQREVETGIVYEYYFVRTVFQDVFAGLLHEPAKESQILDYLNQAHDVSVFVMRQQNGACRLHFVAAPANDFGVGFGCFKFANHHRGVLIAAGFPRKEKELFCHDLETFGYANQGNGGHDHGSNHPATCPKNVFVLFHQ